MTCGGAPSNNWREHGHENAGIQGLRADYTVASDGFIVKQECGASRAKTGTYDGHKTSTFLGAAPFFRSPVRRRTSHITHKFLAFLGVHRSVPYELPTSRTLEAWVHLV